MAASQNYGTGRRKCAVARVWLKPGEGKITINGKDFRAYLGRPVLEILVKSPLVHLGLDAKYDVVCTTKGSASDRFSTRLLMSSSLGTMDSRPVSARTTV